MKITVTKSSLKSVPSCFILYFKRFFDSNIVDKKRGNREFKYIEFRTNLESQIKKTRKRPKGSKIKRERKKLKKKKKRGEEDFIWLERGL
ncbi:MAG: hypothetical protein V3V33_06290 [Candidatus Lokiarchaeia archaeon]